MMLVVPLFLLLLHGMMNDECLTTPVPARWPMRRSSFEDDPCGTRTTSVTKLRDLLLQRNV